MVLRKLEAFFYLKKLEAILSLPYYNARVGKDDLTTQPGK
jgi:hypothetical protein